MKIFKTNRLWYFYIFAFIYFIAMIIFFFRYGFDVPMVVSYIVIFSFTYLILFRDKIKVFDNYIEIYSYLWIKKRTISYIDMKSLKIEKYNEFPTKFPISTICVLDKKGNVLGYLPYTLYAIDDIKEIMEIIKSTSKKIKFSIDVENLFK